MYGTILHGFELYRERNAKFNFDNIDDDSIFKPMIWLYFDFLCLFLHSNDGKKNRGNYFLQTYRIHFVFPILFKMAHCQFDHYFYRTSWFSARRREIIVTQFHCKIFVMRFVDSRIQVSGMYARIHWRVTWLMYCILEITRELLFERMCCDKFFISPLRARLYRACCD